MNRLPKVSILIPVYDDRPRLRACLSALAAQSYRGDTEIIVIDNGSRDAPLELAAEFPGVTFLSEERPGAYAARNTGLLRATGDVLAFTDSDCLPSPTWVERLVDALLEHPEAGFVGGHVRIALQDERASAAELYDLVTAFPQAFYVETLHFAVTANMATTREVMQRVGVFDAELRSGGDREWGNRCIAAGYRGHYEPSAVVTHPARHSDEIFKKIRRVSAGMRRAKPEPLLGIKNLYRILVPPVGETKPIWGEDGKHLTLAQKLGVFLFAWRVRCYRATSVVWYHLTDAEAPRA